MKSPNGHGSLYRHRDGRRWQAAISLPDGRRRVKTCTSRAAAAQWLSTSLRAQGAGLDLGNAETMGEFMRRWLPMRQVAPSTMEQGIRMNRLYLGPIAHIRVAALRHQQIDQLLGGMQAQGKAPNTRRLVRSLLRRALQDAMREGIVVRNEAALSTAPSIPAPDPSFLTAAQAQALLAAAGDGHLAIFVWIALYTGMRRGEVLGLQWGDVDWGSGTISVRRSLYRRHVGPGTWSLETTEPKTARSRRQLPMSAPLRQRLLEHQMRQAARMQAAGKPLPGPDGFVVCSLHGSCEDPDNLTKYCRRLGRQAGIEGMGVSPHLLRHAVATLMLAAGVDIATVSTTLGHSGIAITARHYAFVLDGGKRAAADALAGILSVPSVAHRLPIEVVADPQPPPAA